MKTFTIEEIKALYNMYMMYIKDWNKAIGGTKAIKVFLSFTEWLDVYEQGNDELIYY